MSVDFNFDVSTFPRWLTIDLSKNDFLRSRQSVIYVVKQQRGDHDDDRRADHEKDSAHERGI